MDELLSLHTLEVMVVGSFGYSASLHWLLWFAIFFKCASFILLQTTVSSMINQVGDTKPESTGAEFVGKSFLT